VAVFIALTLRYIEFHNCDQHPPADTLEWTMKELIVHNYWVSGVIPTILILGFLQTLIFKNTHSVNSLVKIVMSIILFLGIIGVFIYQYYEKTLPTKNWPYHITIILPRTIYSLFAITFVYLLFGLRNPNLIYEEFPAQKAKRIVSFFTLFLISIFPVLMLINGPNVQIVHLCCLIIGFGANYVLKNSVLHNSLFHYVFYAIATFNIFYASGHVLDFLSPKIKRTFVGFPEFNIIITFTIAIIDFVATTIIMILSIPVHSIVINSEANFEPVKETRTLTFDVGTPKVDTNLKTDKSVMEPILRCIRNLVVFMLYFDIVQDSYTRFLVFNFEGRFFQASHTEFTFRFINWAMYGVVLGSCFILGKA